MPKKSSQKPMSNVADLQPDELHALKAVVLDYVHKIESIDNEITLLNGDKKEITEEFEDKIDLVTLKKVLQIIKIEQGVAHKDTFDLMKEALTDPSL
jgi:uncharacterized protein (UPF0335 family)